MADVHNRTQINKRMSAKLEESSLSQENTESVQAFVDKLKASGIGKDRIRNYLWSFEYLADHIDFALEDATQDELIKLAGVINGDLREDLSEYSIAELKKTLSKYYGWHLDRRSDIDFLGTTVDQTRMEGLKPEEVLRPSEVKSIVRSASNPRDKALIMTLWASGGRIEATLNTRWKDLELDGLGSQLRFTSNKTQPRRVPVAEAAPYLKAYAEVTDADPDDYIFTKGEGWQKDEGTTQEQMNYGTAYSAIDRAVQNTDIPETRQTSPHGYRKSRATFLASQGMNAPQLMEFFGWSQMETAKKYVGLAQNQLESAFNEAIGLQDQDQTGLDMDEEELRPRRCHVCGSIVSPAQKSCYNCSTTITADDLLSALEPEKEQAVSPDSALDMLKNMDADELKQFLD
ncbi:MAG: tyrosine-type recombinase/integrase [Candidatus Nanohaloarchaea archaeon]